MLDGSAGFEIPSDVNEDDVCVATVGECLDVLSSMCVVIHAHFEVEANTMTAPLHDAVDAFVLKVVQLISSEPGTEFNLHRLKGEFDELMG